MPQGNCGNLRAFLGAGRKLGGGNQSEGNEKYCPGI